MDVRLLQTEFAYVKVYRSADIVSPTPVQVRLELDQVEFRAYSDGSWPSLYDLFDMPRSSSVLHSWSIDAKCLITLIRSIFSQLNWSIIMQNGPSLSICGQNPAW